MPPTEGEPRKYRGPFCTGHTFFPMTAVLSYTEAIHGEFREDPLFFLLLIQH